MSLPWKRLIRFQASDGRILRGEPIIPAAGETDLGLITEVDGLHAKLLSGSDIYDVTGKTQVTDEIVTVKRILSPLAQSDVPIMRCVGLNYAKHSMDDFLLGSIQVPMYQPDMNLNSPRSRAQAPTVSVYFLQAEYLRS